MVGVGEWLKGRSLVLSAVGNSRYILMQNDRSAQRVRNKLHGKNDSYIKH